MKLLFIIAPVALGALVGFAWLHRYECTTTAGAQGAIAYVVRFDRWTGRIEGHAWAPRNSGFNNWQRLDAPRFDPSLPYENVKPSNPVDFQPEK